MKKLLLLIGLILPLNVLAETSADVTSEASILLNDNTISSVLLDNDYKTSATISSSDVISIKSEKSIKGLYIVYYSEVKTGVINYNESDIKVGENNLLHEYIELDDTSLITLKYDENVRISDIYVLSDGELPDYIQKWDNPYDEADLVLFSTHGDDEQLFFLGLIPTYVDRGMKVEVVYLAHHNDNPRRLHEQLNGLWEVGIKNYPVFGIIPDALSETLQGAIRNLGNAGLDEETVIKFQTENIRRFKPLVIVGHDEEGEYSHGQHILNTYTLKIALERSNDKNYYTDLEYDLWEPQKVYFHLYKENQITMDYDTPLESFNGETAYEVSKRGYSKHESQQWTWFTRWINGTNNSYTKATDIKTYSPLIYGLYKTTVGEDINKNDMFENVTLRKDEPIKESVKKIVDTIKPDNKEDYKLYIICSGILALFILVCILRKKKK